jgi:hypothetical protein
MRKVRRVLNERLDRSDFVQHNSASGSLHAPFYDPLANRLHAPFYDPLANRLHAAFQEMVRHSKARFLHQPFPGDLCASLQRVLQNALTDS